MVDTGIFCTTAEVQRKAGNNASTTANVEAYINDFVTQAESVINSKTRYNWSDKYGTLDVDVQGILKFACSNLSAIYVISFDMSGFTSRSEAQTMLDVLNDGFLMAISILKEKATETFMLGA